MNKQELVEVVAAQLDMPKSRVEAVLTAGLAAIEAAVVAGDRVALAGFGVFESVDAGPRKGRNITTGEVLEIPASRRPRFVPGRPFRDAVAAQGSASRPADDQGAEFS